MNNIFSEECINNILGHLKTCWNYDYPTGKTLETAIYRGVKPFYKDTQLKGAPSTITDVGKESQAFDIKGSKVLGHIHKITKAANTDLNSFFKQILPNGKKIIVRVPFSTVTQVRRPKVNLHGYTGDAEKTITEQITDYHNFAIETSADDGYSELYSIVCLYGVSNGYKSIFLTIDKFNIPECVEFDIGTKEDNTTPCSYRAHDVNGNVVFSLSSFNSGSSNFYKRFYTTQGILMTWPEEEEDIKIFTKEDLDPLVAIQIVK